MTNTNLYAVILAGGSGTLNLALKAFELIYWTRIMIYKLQFT